MRPICRGVDGIGHYCISAADVTVPSDEILKHVGDHVDVSAQLERAFLFVGAVNTTDVYGEADRSVASSFTGASHLKQQ